MCTRGRNQRKFEVNGNQMIKTYIRNSLLWIVAQIINRSQFISWGTTEDRGFTINQGLDWPNDFAKRIRFGENNVFIDVGANRGAVTERLLSIDKSATIHCFEPEPKHAKKLQEVFNGKSNVHVYPFALGEDEEDADFYLYKDSKLNSALRPGEEYPFDSENLQKIQIKYSTVDSVFLREVKKIDLLKIDTQGFDLSVIKGAKKLLAKRTIKNILVEINFIQIYESQAAPLELLSFLFEYGFRIVGFYNLKYRNDRLGWCDVLLTLK